MFLCRWNTAIYEYAKFVYVKPFWQLLDGRAISRRKISVFLQNFGALPVCVYTSSRYASWLDASNLHRRTPPVPHLPYRGCRYRIFNLWTLFFRFIWNSADEQLTKHFLIFPFLSKSQFFSFRIKKNYSINDSILSLWYAIATKRK